MPPEANVIFPGVGDKKIHCISRIRSAVSEIERSEVARVGLLHPALLYRRSFYETRPVIPNVGDTTFSRAFSILEERFA